MAYSLLFINNLEVPDTLTHLYRHIRFSARSLIGMIQMDGRPIGSDTGLSNRGRMMEADKWQAQGSSNRAIEYEKHKVLILNQNAIPCAADKYDSLIPFLKKSLPVKYIRQESVNRSPDKLSSARD